MQRYREAAKEQLADLGCDVGVVEKLENADMRLLVRDALTSADELHECSSFKQHVASVPCPAEL